MSPIAPDPLAPPLIMTRLVRRLVRRWIGEERAAAMVEFAIIAPLLFALIFGIVDFGRVFLLYSNLTNVAREAARQGAVLQTPDTAAIGLIVRTKLAAVERWRDSGTVRVSFPGAVGNKTVLVSIESFPFKPATFLVLRRIPRLTTKAEFRWEPQ